MSTLDDLDALYEAANPRKRRALYDRLRAALAAPSTPEPSGLPERVVERLGFRELLDIADALLTRYPPGTIVCSHDERADIGAQTAAAVADLVASCRARLAESQP